MKLRSLPATIFLKRWVSASPTLGEEKVYIISPTPLNISSTPLNASQPGESFSLVGLIV